jgi:GntR family transcriptional regulator
VADRETFSPPSVTSIRPETTRSLPAYLQLEEELAEQIDTGELSAGDQIPTERELAEATGVSRMTVRAALGRLEQRGLIIRRQGRGTFVAEPKLRQDGSHLRGFFEGSIGQGVFPVSRVVEKAQIVATRHLANELSLRLGENVYKVVRVRAANGSPVVLETSFFPARIVPGLLDRDLAASSIYRLMDRHHDARPVRARQSLEPIVAGEAESQLLEVPIGSPLMLVERTAWDRHDRAVEHARDLYRGDRSRFVTELSL